MIEYDEPDYNSERNIKISISEKEAVEKQRARHTTRYAKLIFRFHKDGCKCSDDELLEDFILMNSARRV